MREQLVSPVGHQRLNQTIRFEINLMSQIRMSIWTVFTILFFCSRKYHDVVGSINPCQSERWIPEMLFENSSFIYFFSSERTKLWIFALRSFLICIGVRMYERNPTKPPGPSHPPWARSSHHCANISYCVRLSARTRTRRRVVNNCAAFRAHFSAHTHRLTRMCDCRIHFHLNCWR